MQSWVGEPRTIRLNVTQSLILKTSDKTQLDQIYSAFANTISRDLYVVLKEPWMRFRKWFNKFLVPPPEHLRNNDRQSDYSRKRQKYLYASNTEQDFETQRFSAFTHSSMKTRLVTFDISRSPEILMGNITKKHH